MDGQASVVVSVGQLTPPRPLSLDPALLYALRLLLHVPHPATSWSPDVLSALCVCCPTVRVLSHCACAVLALCPPSCLARSSPISKNLGELPNWDPGRVTEAQIVRQMSRVLKGAGARARPERRVGVLAPGGARRLCVSTCPPAPMTPTASQVLCPLKGLDVLS